MFFKTCNFVILSLLTIGFVSGIVTHNAVATATAAQTNKTSNTFTDPNSGISFHYPSDWHATSKEYFDALLGKPTANSQYNGTLSNLLTPIAFVIPDSLDATNFGVISEILPYPMSAEKYLDLNKKQALMDPSPPQINNVTPITVGGLNGFKYNIILPQNIIQTQIVFVKGSTGYDIAYMIGDTNKSKNLADINSMINSFKFNK